MMVLVGLLSCWFGMVLLGVENIIAWFWTSDTYIDSVAVGNVDADAAVEIVTGGSYFDGTRDNAQLMVWNGATLAVENIIAWFWTSDTYIDSVAVGNVDADAAVEIVTWRILLRQYY